MKVLVTEETKEGLCALMGKDVLVFCNVYIYHGKLVGINDTCIKLTNAKLVYETGAFNGALKDAQALPTKDWYIQLSSVESFGEK